MLKVAVITVSDRAYRKEYEDLSGPKIKELIDKSDLNAEVSLSIIPDEPPVLKAALEDNLDKDFIITTGGTGISPRDITPDVTEDFCDRSLPGISELLRRESYRETKYAVLSRGYSGIKGRTILINFPGSQKAVSLCMDLLLPIMAHAKKMLLGCGH